MTVPSALAADAAPLSPAWSAALGLTAVPRNDLHSLVAILMHHQPQPTTGVQGLALLGRFGDGKVSSLRHSAKTIAADQALAFQEQALAGPRQLGFVRLDLAEILQNGQVLMDPEWAKPIDAALAQVARAGRVLVVVDMPRGISASRLQTIMDKVETALAQTKGVAAFVASYDGNPAIDAGWQAVWARHPLMALTDEEPTLEARKRQVAVAVRQVQQSNRAKFEGLSKAEQPTRKVLLSDDHFIANDGPPVKVSLSAALMRRMALVDGPAHGALTPRSQASLGDRLQARRAEHESPSDQAPEISPSRPKR